MKYQEIKNGELILRNHSLEELEWSAKVFLKAGYKVKKPIHITDNFFKSLFNPYYAHFKLIMYKP